MPWPTMADYQEAIQNPRSCFNDPELQQGAPVLTPLGLPKPITGAFASVYQLACQNRQYAVRCFLRYHPDQEQRYLAVSNYLKRVRLPYMATFNLLRRGIQVRGDWFPILKMEWLNGYPLHTYVERSLNQPARLYDLAERFRVLVTDLGKASLAHGDLQHGNILVVNHELRLVDYDGMFVPGLEGMVSHEVGHRNYQHPQRTEADFGPHIDNFSAWVIYVSLRALSVQPALWTLVDAGDECLLFRHNDFVNPGASRVMAQLEQIPDESFRALFRDFRSILGIAPANIPPLGRAAHPVQRQMTRWWKESLARPQPDLPRIDPVEAYRGAEWVLDYVDPAPPPVEDESEPSVERYVLSAYGMVAYLLGVGLLHAWIPVITVLALSLTGLLGVAGLLAVEYSLFPEVQEKRRILGRMLLIRSEIRVQEHDARQFDARRQRLVREETEQLSRLDAEFEQAINEALTEYPLNRREIPGVGLRLELRLRMFGIRSAADVEESRIAQINGIDQARADSLLAWRKKVEQRIRGTESRALGRWRIAQQVEIRQAFRERNAALDGEEAAFRQQLDHAWTEFERLRDDLREYDNVTFAAYLKWVLF